MKYTFRLRVTTRHDVSRRVPQLPGHTQDVHEVLTNADPLTAEWGVLVEALKPWGWHYFRARFPFTWEWRLNVKGLTEDEKQLVARYHKTVGTKFHNDPDPTRKDDASAELRVHLKVHGTWRASTQSNILQSIATFSTVPAYVSVWARC